MFPRIMGLETEYVLKRNPAVPNQQADDFFIDYRHWLELRAWIPKGVALENFSDQQYLKNGGRFYLDNGGHPEYATPEAISSRDVVRYAKSGDRILWTALTKANEQWQNERGFAYELYKNNRDSLGNQCGSHHNFLVRRVKDRSAKPEDLVMALGPFLASAVIFSGSGWIDESGAYELSQRASAIRHIYSTDSTGIDGGRGLINIRDEALANDEQYFRFHFIAADANMSESQLFWEFGAMDIVLEMIEEDFLPKTPFGSFGKYELIPAFHEFASDPTLRRVRNFGRTQMSAVDLQEGYYEWAVKFLERSGHINDERRRIMEIWREMIDCARSSNPMEALEPYCDYAAKFGVIHAKVLKRFGDFDGFVIPPCAFNVAKQCDYHYHKLAPDDIAERLLAHGLINRIVTEEEIVDAVLAPSSGACATRAHARAQQLAWIDNHIDPMNSIFIKWEETTIRHHTGVDIHTFSNLDPFSPDPHIPHDGNMRHIQSLPA